MFYLEHQILVPEPSRTPVLPSRTHTGPLTAAHVHFQPRFCQICALLPLIDGQGILSFWPRLHSTDLLV